MSIDMINYDKIIYPGMLSDEEKSQLVDYTAFSYALINSELRHGNTSDYDYEIGLLDRAISKYELKSNIRVYRDIFIRKSEMDEFMFKLDVGHITDKGYQSTSFNRGIFDIMANIRLCIDVPKGYNGASIRFLSMIQKEDEFLIGRNAQLAISDVKTVDNRESSIKYLVKAKAI